jgi:hypothetical protein
MKSLGKFCKQGGASIGWTNSGFPLARLTVTQDQVFLWTALGVYEFNKFQIVQLQPIKTFGINGVRILHCKSTYPESLVFTYFGSAEVFSKAVEDTGFIPMGDLRQDFKALRKDFPIRVSAMLGLLSFYAGVFSSLGLKPLLFSLFLGGLLVQSFIPLQSLILGHGRHIDEIRHYLRAVILVSVITILCL